MAPDTPFRCVAGGESDGYIGTTETHGIQARGYKGSYCDAFNTTGCTSGNPFTSEYSWDEFVTDFAHVPDLAQDKLQ